MKSTIVAACLCVAGALSPAEAATYAIDFIERGGDVFANGSGAIDLTGFTYLRGVGAPAAGVYPHVGYVLLNGGSYGLYSVATPDIDFSLASIGPIGVPIQTGALHAASASFGSVFGFYADIDAAYLPVGYVSNTQMWSTASWSGHSFESLGMKEGRYTYALGPSTTVTVTVGVPLPPVAAVPLPAGLGLLGGALALLGFARRRQI